MVLVQNNSKHSIRIVYQGAEYQLPVGEPAEIPEIAASLFFGYGIDITKEHVDMICQRIKRYNPKLTNMPDKEIWDEIVKEMLFGKDVIQKEKLKK